MSYPGIQIKWSSNQRFFSIKDTCGRQCIIDTKNSQEVKLPDHTKQYCFADENSLYIIDHKGYIRLRSLENNTEQSILQIKSLTHSLCCTIPGFLCDNNKTEPTLIIASENEMCVVKNNTLRRIPREELFNTEQSLIIRDITLSHSGKKVAVHAMTRGDNWPMDGIYHYVSFYDIKTGLITHASEKIIKQEQESCCQRLRLLWNKDDAFVTLCGSKYCFCEDNDEQSKSICCIEPTSLKIWKVAIPNDVISITSLEGTNIIAKQQRTSHTITYPICTDIMLDAIKSYQNLYSLDCTLPFPEKLCRILSLLVPIKKEKPILLQDTVNTEKEKKEEQEEKEKAEEQEEKEKSEEQEEQIEAQTEGQEAQTAQTEGQEKEQGKGEEIKKLNQTVFSSVISSLNRIFNCDLLHKNSFKAMVLCCVALPMIYKIFFMNK
jgi:hypothetical protein